ncbi:hypothetical protein AXX12_18380 [Anaerosporomusa subterranea]|uniref:Type VI secretion system spike protein VgrG3-like C-terminal domain-containing protein n=1 Tax=Anaerosporomusa subterranea TaxID=1794912 RepID=A0A154BSC3_ANASB|nr:chitosanase [Anaerosporomusa subterranea]KYZ76872.1 hypothetical protein AXX12_18380 [Anaerosporomusa subterranea]
MKLGDLSAKYESNGDPGAISSGEGDAGGVSYGAYQFAANAGVPGQFVAWLKQIGYLYADELAEAGVPGCDEFSDAWLRAAARDPDGFLAAQHEFVRQSYYEPAREQALAAGINIDGCSFALQNVVWSAAVQYGAYYVKELFEDAATQLGVTSAADADDAALIQAIYDVRASDEWTTGSPELRPGLIARFEAECRDALAALDSE